MDQMVWRSIVSMVQLLLDHKLLALVADDLPGDCPQQEGYHAENSLTIVRLVPILHIQHPTNLHVATNTYMVHQWASGTGGQEQIIS